jgi:hypothetical protein
VQGARDVRDRGIAFSLVLQRRFWCRSAPSTHRGKFVTDSADETGESGTSEGGPYRGKLQLLNQNTIKSEAEGGVENAITHYVPAPNAGQFQTRAIQGGGNIFAVTISH